MTTHDYSQKTVLELEDIAKSKRRITKDQRKFAYSSLNDRDIAFRQAETELRDVIAELERRVVETDSGSLSERGLQAEIGDCYGVLGGLLRDWEKFSEAARSYQKGRKCEVRVEELGGKSNSYCMVQELVNWILDSPSRLSEDDFRKSLVRAKHEVEQQMTKDRPRDIWAMADLALLSLLIDPRESFDHWNEFDDLRPPKFAYDGTVEVVRVLYGKLKPQFQKVDDEIWQDTIDRLDHTVTA